MEEPTFMEKLNAVIVPDNPYIDATTEQYAYREPQWPTTKDEAMEQTPALVNATENDEVADTTTHRGQTCNMQRCPHVAKYQGTLKGAPLVLCEFHTFERNAHRPRRERRAAGWKGPRMYAIPEVKDIYTLSDAAKTDLMLADLPGGTRAGDILMQVNDNGEARYTRVPEDEPRDDNEDDAEWRCPGCGEGDDKPHGIIGDGITCAG